MARNILIIHVGPVHSLYSMWLKSCDIEGSLVTKKYSIAFGFVSVKFICGKFYFVTLKAFNNEMFTLNSHASTIVGITTDSTPVYINPSHSLYIGIILLKLDSINTKLYFDLLFEQF